MRIWRILSLLIERGRKEILSVLALVARRGNSVYVHGGEVSFLHCSGVRRLDASSEDLCLPWMEGPDGKTYCYIRGGKGMQYVYTVSTLTAALDSMPDITGQAELSLASC